MKLDYIPNPRAGPGAPPEVPATQAVVRHEPWKQGDLVAWQAKMPRLRDDAEKCAQLLSGIITDYFPNWNDVRTLLLELFQPDEREEFEGRSEERQKQEEEKLKAERKRECKEKEREIGLLAVAIAQNYNQRGRGRGFPRRGIRGRGQRGRGFPPPVSPYFNNPKCFYCGNLCHIQLACPLRPVTSAVEVRNYGERPPRPHSQ